MSVMLEANDILWLAGIHAPSSISLEQTKVQAMQCEDLMR
jgi:hypothetical protein